MAILKRCRNQVKLQTEFGQICQYGSTHILRYCHGYWPHAFDLIHNLYLLLFIYRKSCYEFALETFFKGSISDKNRLHFSVFCTLLFMNIIFTLQNVKVNDILTNCTFV